MNLKALSLASIVILFSSSPMLSKGQNRPIGALASPQDSGHFDLKGEKLGESLEAFKKIHPLAHCYKHDPERQATLGEDGCTAFRGVSFAGLPALSDANCDRMDAKVGDGRNCVEGLIASFRGGKLFALTYAVNAEGGREWALREVTLALTEKFGKESASQIWINDAEVLTAYGKEESLGQGKKVSVIFITLKTTEDYSKKDI